VVFTTKRAKDLPIFTEGVGKKGQDTRSYSESCPKTPQTPQQVSNIIVWFV